MSESINKKEFEELLSQPRLLRSLYQHGKIFCELNERNRIEIVGTIDRHESIIIDDFTEGNKNFEQIVDDKERAEAYRDLAKTLEEIIDKEKQDNLRNLEENSKFIKNQQIEIEKVENELKVTKEQLLNSKELVNQLSDKNIELKNSLILIEEKSTELNKKIEKTQNLCDEINLENIIQKILKLYTEKNTEGEEKENLNETISSIALNLRTQHLLQNNLNMQVEAKDVISGIPMFNGDVKLLDGFLNACELYHGLVEENQKTTVLKIIKAKITGEALSKAGPFGDDMNTWQLLKKQLIEKIKKPVSLEYAQEDLNQVFQKKDESIEDYGTRVKAKLKKLNEASKTITESSEQVKVLRKMNEKHAISKFEQNIRNQTIKVLVSAAGKLTLDECISFAMQKELTEKNRNIKACSICGLTNHSEETCRRKKNGRDISGNFNRKKFNDNNGNGQQNRNFNRSQNFDRKQFYSSPKNEQKPSTSGYSSNNYKNQYSNFQRPKNGNNGNEKSNETQKNVKVVTGDENNDMATVKEVLKDAQNSKN